MLTRAPSRNESEASPKQGRRPGRSSSTSRERISDSQGSAKLGEIHEFLAADGIRLRLARLKPDTAVVLKADGVLDQVGSEQIHGNVHRAVEAELNAVRELQPG